MVKNLPASAGDTTDKGSALGLGRASGVGNGRPLQYSFLENSMDRGAWWPTVHWVTKSHIRPSTHGCAHTHTHAHTRTHAHAHTHMHTHTHACTHTTISVNLNISKVNFLRY